MTCPNFVIWRPIPDGTIIKAQAVGDDEVYNAFITVRRNGVQEPSIRHQQLDPGPASRPMSSADRVTLRGSLGVLRDVERPVTLEIWLEDENANPIDVIDGTGGMVPARCQWAVASTAMSPQLIELRLFGGSL